MFDSDPLASLAILAISLLTLVILRRFHLRAVAGLPDGGVARQMANIIFIVAMGHVCLFMLVPSVLRPVTGWADDFELDIARSEIVYVYLIEIASFAIWAAGFTFVWRGRWLAAAEREPGGPNSKLSAEGRLFLGMVLILGVWRLVDIFVTGGGFVNPNLERDDFGARWGWLVGCLADLSGTAVGFYVLALGRHRVGKMAWTLAIIGALAFALSFGAMGVRGAQVWPLLWWVLLIVLYRPRRDWPRLLLPAFVLLVLLFVFSEYIKETLGSATLSGADLSQKVAMLSSQEASASDPIGSTAFRLGCASRYSVGFTRMWETGRGAFWNPIANTLYAPLPRRFFPDKPWPTSLRGDQYSAGMYLCVAEFTPFANYTMTEFLTGSHAYWEFGWPGVVGLSLAGGMILGFIAALLCRMGLAGPAMIFLFFKPWGYNNPKLWFSDLMLEITQIVPIMLVLWMLSRFVTRRWGKSTTHTTGRGVSGQ